MPHHRAYLGLFDTCPVAIIKAEFVYITWNVASPLR